MKKLKALLQWFVLLELQQHRHWCELNTADGAYNECPHRNGAIMVGYARRHITMHQVAETELDMLFAGSNSLNWIFFGICIGALLSFVGVLLSAPPDGPKSFATFVSLTILFFMGTLFLE